MKIYSFHKGGYASNSYAVCDDAMSVCFAVDPALTPDEMRTAVPSLPEIKGVLLTHGHFDHILALATYISQNIPVYIHPNDRDMLTDGYKNASSLVSITPITAYGASVKEALGGQKIAIGGESITVMHTPGHTAGSVCYLADSFVITGDTVFAFGDRGRTDLYSGDEAQIYRSIEKILALDGTLTVYSGHGPKTKIADERKYY